MKCIPPSPRAREEEEEPGREPEEPIHPLTAAGSGASPLHTTHSGAFYTLWVVTFNIFCCVLWADATLK